MVKPTLYALLAAFVLAPPTAAFAEEGIASVASRYPLPETVTRVRIALEHAGMRVSTIVEPTRDPALAGSEREPSQLMIVGDARARAQLVSANPLLALDLPTKVLVWEDASEVKASFNDPDFLRMRHSLSDDEMTYFRRIESLIEHAIE